MSYSDLQQQPIAMFDMDGTLLDLAFDDFIWNHQLPIRYAEQHQCSLEQSTQALFQFYQTGELKPYIQKTYSLEETPQALYDMLERRVMGKLVVTP